MCAATTELKGDGESVCLGAREDLRQSSRVSAQSHTAAPGAARVFVVSERPTHRRRSRLRSHHAQGRRSRRCLLLARRLQQRVREGGGAGAVVRRAGQQDLELLQVFEDRLSRDGGELWLDAVARAGLGRGGARGAPAAPEPSAPRAAQRCSRRCAARAAPWRCCGAQDRRRHPPPAPAAVRASRSPRACWRDRPASSAALQEHPAASSPWGASTRSMQLPPRHLGWRCHPGRPAAAWREWRTPRRQSAAGAQASS